MVYETADYAAFAFHARKKLFAYKILRLYALSRNGCVKGMAQAAQVKSYPSAAQRCINRFSTPCLQTTLLRLLAVCGTCFPMLTYPQFSPDILTIGPVSIRWYGCMYLLGFLCAWMLGRKRAAKTGVFTPQQFDDLLTFGILGVLIGARLGYVLFYNPGYYLENPLEIFEVWHGGMSFHGGFLGVIIAQGLAARRYGKKLFETMDFMAPLVPPGLFFGRIGNFINAELWGNTTTVPWGMVFPGAGPDPRHPSQLYEATLEGLVLFIIVWTFSAKPRPTMAVSGVFALGYGIFRFFVEFFRQPDAHIGYLAGNFLTMGMVLCIPIILTGLLLLYLAYRTRTNAA